MRRNKCLLLVVAVVCMTLFAFFFSNIFGANMSQFFGLEHALNQTKKPQIYLLNNNYSIKELQRRNTNMNEMIDLSLLCSGNGTSSNRWIVNETIFTIAIKSLSETVRTIYLSSGHYYSPSSIHIDFGQILNDNNAYNMFREGIGIIGKFAKIEFAPSRNENKASFHIEWTSSNGETVGLFFWEISGISFAGDNDYELVRIGSSDPDTMAWNSCIFGVNVNNRYHGDNNSAVGIVMERILQSRINIIGTCAQGIGVLLENMEFSTLISGSFSNGQINAHNIYNQSVGLKLVNCVGNTFDSINLEVDYDGIYFVDYTYGNAFNSIISNNQDMNGFVLNVINDRFPTQITNEIQFLTIRAAIQGNNTFPNLWPNNFSDSLQINHIIQG